MDRTLGNPWTRGLSSVIAYFALLASLPLALGFITVALPGFRLFDPHGLFWIAPAALAGGIGLLCIRKLWPDRQWGRTSFILLVIAAELASIGAPFLWGSVDLPILPYVYCLVFGLIIGVAVDTITRPIGKPHGLRDHRASVATVLVLAAALLLSLHTTYVLDGSTRLAFDAYQGIKTNMDREQVRSVMSNAWCVNVEDMQSRARPGKPYYYGDTFFFGSHYLPNAVAVQVWYGLYLPDGKQTTVPLPYGEVDRSQVQVHIQQVLGPNDESMKIPSNPVCEPNP